MYKWLSDFLFNRTARVKLDGSISRQVKLREGVPQGGVVSPTLFLVYINDITTTVPRHVSNTLHADDFAVWCAEEHTTTAVHRIQNTINEVCSWTESWALQFNTTKTISTLFTLSTAKEKVSLRLNNQPVPPVETPTFLGVTLDTRLTWKPHLEAVEARKLAIMKKLAGTTWGANSDILKQVYSGAVRPVVEYASTTWDTASKNQQEKARQSVEHGHENYLRCYEKHTNPTNGKDHRPSTFGVQYWVQSCHPRGKAEETD